ncbi:MAG: HD domain-containing phosphohydrolase [Vicinamibacterales bacterium]
MGGHRAGPPDGLRSRVARRVAVLFVACAIVPMAGLAVVTWLRTSDYLGREARARLGYDAKTVMMEALGRLDLRAGALHTFGTALTGDPPPADVIEARIDDLFTPRPAVLTWIPDDGPVRHFGLGADVPPLSADQEAWLARGLPLLVQAGTADGPPRDLLVVGIAGPRQRGRLVASVSYARLFGLDDQDPLPPDSSICVQARGRTLVCSDGVAPELAAASLAIGPDQDATLTDPSGARLTVRSRSLPLQVGYGADPWTLVLMRPEAVVTAPLRAFLRDFWWVTVLSLLVVSLLTLTQVKRQMRPLAALMDATRRLARRQFSTPVRITSGDEFEALGEAFNQLTRELKHQFEELEAFSIGTLEALARSIDAKSPWTAGHSGRVTELAVRIAAEMALPEVEIVQLRRGGLIHDIGKLATPPGILDKAGRLTAEEETIIRQHTEQGVHILEPIPAFRPLLPIVAEHHERWDGSGYPRGLAGTAIARTARVLAVADVFDAMRSDRPYRPGLPLANVVAMIQAASGTHFDPEVVAAFLRLIRRESGADATAFDRSA